MPNNRDDFTKKTIDRMAKRVGYRCSNPNCRKLTCGAAENPDDYVNIGVAAHIRAAAPGGKRYDQKMTVSQRKSILNGIWLCQSCSKLIDSDELRYTVDLLHQWKYDAETESARELENQRNGRYKADSSFHLQENIRLSSALNQEISELLEMMEQIHQKLDAAKQDENVFMTQAYEKRLEGLMLLYTNLISQLEKLVGGGTTGKISNSNDFSPAYHCGASECVKNKPLPSSRKKGINAGMVLATGIAVGILVWSAVSDAGVLSTVAGVIGTIGLGWGFCELLQKDEKANSIELKSLESKVDIKVNMNSDRMTPYMETLRSAVASLASEVEKLHLDRIEYERTLVETDCVTIQEK